PASPLRIRSLESSGWVAADFDGDHRLDIAVTRLKSHNECLLELELSSKRAGGSLQPPAVPVTPSSAFGFHLSPQDVGGAHDLDIVITWGFARVPGAVWINDGTGSFAEGSLEAYPAWNHPEICFYPQNRPVKSQLVFSPNRRSRFSLEPGDS